MIDPITTGIVVGISWVGRKVLGPTADHYGHELKTYVSSGRASENINNILEKAHAKLGSTINEEAEVPPKILKDLIFEGAFCEEDIEAEYRAGIIASSRSKTGESDAQPFVSLINRLSSHELVLHFALYSAVKLLMSDSDINPLHMNKLTNARILLRFDAFESITAVSALSLERLHILVQEGLIHSNFASGEADHLISIYGGNTANFKRGGVVFSPTSLGCMLFMYANGKGKQPHSSFFQSSWKTVPIDGINIRIEDTFKL